ncbi:MAG: ComEC/Rec2 family competence protein [Clostridia bacterium]|nr:ComEC/Rec2 family competence protein [Clostridia bacterium]
MSGAEQKENLREKARLPRVNFRPALYCALFLAFGIFLYLRIRFGSVNVSDFLFLAFFLFFGLPPLTKKRVVPVLVLFFVCAGLGVLSAHLYTERFLSGATEGEYAVQGVVIDISEGEGYGIATLDDVSLDGRSFSGKLRVSVGTDEVRRGDIVSFEGNVKRTGLPRGDFYSSYCYQTDIRYTAGSPKLVKTGTTANPLLRLKARLYDTLHTSMDKDSADLSFALLTGDSKGMDGGLKQAVQRGGIAHMFAVSGLHIGILYAAVSLACKRMGKYSVIPAACGALLYCAFCGFTVSSVRAVIMCTAFGVQRAFGRKTDLLSTLSFSAIPVLLFLPAQWLSAGFRLSYGAVLGLALFSGSLSRGFKKIRIPAFLANYLSASISVQLFTLPVVLESFGYFPVWGFFLNFFLIPVLPVLFLGLLVCSVFALIIPPAAFVFLYIPASVMSLLPFLFAAVSLSFVITGFSLGAGSVVYYVGAAVLSGRLRLKFKLRCVVAGVLSALFVVIVVFENVTVTGCKITVEEGDGAGAALVQTNSENVLIIGGDVSLSRCEDFLAHRYGGTLDAVIVVSENEQKHINRAAFLHAETVYACEEIATGLRKTNLVFAESFTVGELSFRYEGSGKLYMLAEGSTVEFDFENSSPLGGDLFIESGSGGLKYFLKNGIIRKI